MRGTDQKTNTPIFSWLIGHPFGTVAINNCTGPTEQVDQRAVNESTIMTQFTLQARVDSGL
jgi:hypothetical protein